MDTRSGGKGDPTTISLVPSTNRGCRFHLVKNNILEMGLTIGGRVEGLRLPISAILELADCLPLVLGSGLRNPPGEESNRATC